MIGHTGRDEQDRLASLHRYDILDTEPEEAFDRITRLTQVVLQVPIAVVSLVDRDRQWFKSRCGMPAAETARSDSFCTYTIRQREPFIVEDALADARFRNSSLVTGEPYVRYYAGVPLCGRNGHNIGALCAMDTKVRYFGEAQIRMLQDLAQLIVNELELRTLASTDSLTGALSRRTFLDAATRDMARAKRTGTALSCAVFDIDHFKTVNDTCGHAVGDQVLQEVLTICSSRLREGDYVGRLGGEEFAIIFPDTPPLRARDVVERLRRSIERLSVAIADRSIRVTASFGVAGRQGPEQGVRDLLRAADAAMYLAKSNGRNCTFCDCDTGETACVMRRQASQGVPSARQLS